MKEGLSVPMGELFVTEARALRLIISERDKQIENLRKQLSDAEGKLSEFKRDMFNTCREVNELKRKVAKYRGVHDLQYS